MDEIIQLVMVWFGVTVGACAALYYHNTHFAAPLQQPPITDKMLEERIMQGVEVRLNRLDEKLNVLHEARQCNSKGGCY